MTPGYCRYNYCTRDELNAMLSASSPRSRHSTVATDKLVDADVTTAVLVGVQGASLVTVAETRLNDRC